MELIKQGKSHQRDDIVHQLENLNVRDDAKDRKSRSESQKKNKLKDSSLGLHDFDVLTTLGKFKFNLTLSIPFSFILFILKFLNSENAKNHSTLS